MLYHAFKSADVKSMTQECFDILRQDNQLPLEHSNLWYPESLPTLPKLQSFLEQLGLTDYIHGIALNVTSGGMAIPIHLDTGPFTWSLNLPLYNCDDSLVAIYNTKQQPVLKFIPGSDVTYLGYEDESELTTEAVLESTYPMLLNVKNPHNVINKSDKTRVMLLVRIKEDLPLEMLKEKLNALN